MPAHVINLEDVQVLNRVFNAAFIAGLGAAPVEYQLFTQIAPSTAKTEDFSWLGAVPTVREWLGARVHKKLAGHNYAITNRKWESTVDIEREVLEDNGALGHAARIQDMGKEANDHRGRLAWSTFAAGKVGTCYDGGAFFRTNHKPDPDGSYTYSNYTSGAKAPWYLVDASRPLKPIILTDRVAPELRAPMLTDESVQESDVFSWRTRARYAAGYGLPQLAHRAEVDLTETNFNAAYAAMRAIKDDTGERYLNIRPTHLIVPPSLRTEALKLIKATTDNGGQNVNAGIVQVLESPYIIE